MEKQILDAVEIAQKQRHFYLLTKVKNNQHLSQSELRELKMLEEKAKREKTVEQREKPAAIAADQLIKTQKLAAQFAGVSTRTIRNWVKDGMPRTGEGYYIKTFLDFYKNNEGKQPTEAKAKGQVADAEYKDAKARLMQIELDIKLGKLVSMEDIERRTVAQILAVKRALLGLGRKLAPQLAKIKDVKKIRIRIDAETRDIIEGFASGRSEGT